MRRTGAPGMEGERKKPGTGNPLHTQELVTVASFRTWRGWRERVARDRYLTLSSLSPVAGTNVPFPSPRKRRTMDQFRVLARHQLVRYHTTFGNRALLPSVAVSAGAHRIRDHCEHRCG